MYIPKLFAGDPSQIAEHVRRWPFATLCTSGALGPYASHVPLLLTASDRLVGHLARANPHTQDLCGTALAIFHGPHAFVSSTWYSVPEQNVSTWNYLAVHATGTVSLLSDPMEALDTALLAFEPPERAPSGRPERDALLESLARAIVAFEIRVTRWESKAKLSQNRSPDDRARVEQRLAQSDDPMDRAIAEEMRRL